MPRPPRHGQLVEPQLVSSSSSSSTTTAHRATLVRRDPRWAQVLARDASADGAFYYSVRTTGVYCRPSCAARPARPENIAFHLSIADAERAGFRACKRCKPGAPSLAAAHATKVAALCRWIESADHVPTLDELADAADWSPYHLHRIFKAVTGVTPRAYAAAHRATRVRTALRSASSVTAAIFEAGFQSNGRFYAEADEILGMTPTSFRTGGEAVAIEYALGTCSLGALLVASTARGVCAILFGETLEALVADLADRFPAATLQPAAAAYTVTVAQVVALVETPAHGLALPLDVRGNAFQLRVWAALRKIPAGTTASYSELAALIGAPKAARAVAQALAANPLAVAIPCHRIVRSDGALAGYRWGVERKQALLARERGK